MSSIAPIPAWAGPLMPSLSGGRAQGPDLPAVMRTLRSHLAGPPRDIILRLDVRRDTERRRLVPPRLDELHPGGGGGGPGASDRQLRQRRTRLIHAYRQRLQLSAVPGPANSRHLRHSPQRKTISLFPSCWRTCNPPQNPVAHVHEPLARRCAHDPVGIAKITFGSCP